MKKLLFELPSQKHDYLSIFCGNETDALLHAGGVRHPRNSCINQSFMITILHFIEILFTYQQEVH